MTGGGTGGLQGVRNSGRKKKKEGSGVGEVRPELSDLSRTEWREVPKDDFIH